MKKIHKILGMLVLTIFAFSCEEQLIVFEGEAISHFTTSAGSLGSKSSADTYAVEVGTTTAAAATVQISVSANSTAIEGVHFETLPGSVSIGAGEFVASFTVVPIVEGITPGEPVILVIDIANSTEDVKLTQTFTLAMDRICDPYPGDWVVTMHDSWGDGWQTTNGSGGPGIQVTLDDGSVLEVTLADGFEGSDIITIPDGTTEAAWYFPGDWYGEISFEITAPEGSLIYTSPQGALRGGGDLPVVLCAP